MNEKRRDLVQKFAALGSLFVLTAVFGATSSAFFTTSNALTVGLQVTSIAYLGLGMTVVIITGGIDLSSGSVLALAGVAAAFAVKAGVPVWAAMCLGVLVGMLAGLTNGLFVARLKLPPFIATLGMMMVARGIALHTTGGRPISGLGERFGVLGNGALLRVMRIGEDGYPDIKFVGIPYPVIVMAVLAVLISVVLTRTRFGRHVYAVGSNQEAARLSGVNVRGTIVAAYVISGFFSGLTGCVLMSRLVTAQPNEGISYEMDAIAAAVIGGASLTTGGVGTISGTIIGAFVIGILRNGLNMNGVSYFVQQIIIGVVILLTVWLDQLRRRSSARVRAPFPSRSRRRSARPRRSDRAVRGREREGREGVSQVQGQRGVPTEEESMKKAMFAIAAMVALSAGTAQAGGEIAVIVKTTNSNFWQNVNKGATDAMKLPELKGYTMTFQGPASESAIADEVAMVENAVTRKVAAIVLAPSDPEALIPAVKKAWEAKIPVIILDSMLGDGGKDYYRSFLATDNEKAGELCAKALIDKVGKEGKIAVMSYVAGVGSEIGRVGGFKKYVQANSKLQIVGTYYSQAQMATALNQTTDVLAANPDLKGIFGANEPTAVGMARALVQAGKAGKVVAVGFDGNEDLQNFVKDGTLSAIAVQGSYQMGSLGVKTALDAIKGKKVEKFVNTGVVIVTKANIEKPEAKNVLY